MLLISLVAQLNFPVFGSIGIGMPCSRITGEHGPALEYVLIVDLGAEFAVQLRAHASMRHAAAQRSVWR